MKNSFNTLFIHTWALLAGIWAIPALAAEDAKRLNEQMPALPEFLPGKMPRVFELPPVTSGSEAAKPGEYRFNFSEVVFKGNTVFVSSELEVVAQPYLNREVTEADIETLRQKISQYYVDQGYINSGALILPIDPQSHRLEIKIVEGRIHRIQLGGMERLRDAYVTNRLQPDRQAPLNMDTLRERFQLLLDDPLIKSANAHLVPGSDLGESTLEVQVSRAKPYGARFAYNNYRPVSIGSEVANVSGWVRNLTGWGDYLALDFQASVEGAPGNHKDVNWKLPLNGRGTELALQYSYGASTVIEEVSRPLDIRSTLENWGLGISQTFYESLRHKLSAGLDWSYQHNRTSLLGFPFSFTPGVKNGETTDRGWRLWQEYQWRTEYQVMALRSTFSHMQNNLQKVTASVTTAQPETSYWVWLGQGQYSRQIFDNQAQFVSRLSVQFANDNLLSLDGMSIGGNNTVRGYRENELIRDRGAVLNLDLQIPVLRGWKDLALTAGPFYDIGHGRNMGAEAATISSSGAAVHANWKGVNLDLAIAKRLSHPAGMVFRDGDWQERGVHFQLSYDFPWI